MLQVGRIGWSVVVVAASISCMSAARAGCPPEWLYGPDQGLPGLSGEVYAMTTWDSDGAGPKPPVLVVAGGFRTAGRVLVRYVAIWNGSAWQSLGAGMGSYVLALTVYNDELSGGWFSTAGRAPA